MVCKSTNGRKHHREHREINGLLSEYEQEADQPQHEEDACFKTQSAGQARNVICEITGHSRESSLDDYDEISENQRRDLSHIISGYHDASKSKQNPEYQLQRASAASPPASSINKYPASSSTVVTSNFQQQTHQLNLNFQPYGFPFFPPTYAPAVPHQTTAFNPQNTNYSGCTITNYYTVSLKTLHHHERNDELL